MTPIPTLLISTVFSWASAIAFGYVAWRLQQRPVSSPDARRAWQLFIIWWAGMSIRMLIGGLSTALAGLHMTSLALALTLSYVNLMIICVALCGLLYYLIYLFTGNNLHLAPLSILFFVYYAVLLYYITASGPTEVIVNRWNTTFLYQNELSQQFILVVLILLIGPEVLAGLAYFSLFFQVKDPTQKYRILLVALSITLWFGSSLVAAFMGLSQYDWWQITSRLITLAATLVIFMAYFPPAWIKRRYGITAVDGEAHAERQRHNQNKPARQTRD